MMKEGIFSNISNADYHRDIGISASGVTLMRDTPAKFYNRYLSLQQPQEPTKPIMLGQALHTAILEPREFDKRFAVLPEDIKRRAGKAYEAFQIAMHDRYILNANEFDKVIAMANAVKQHPLYERIMRDARIEHSIYWINNGIQYKARPDLFNNEFVFDLKTTASADKEDFQKSIMTYGYHRQAAMCLDGLTKLTDRKYKQFIFFCVESEEPYLTAAYVMDDVALQIGRYEYEQAALKYHQCLTAGVWPGYSEDLQLISLPEWYVRTKQ